ncbi:MAG: hypothetical protein R2851_08925 [Caldilineaceae bacterium]
MRGTAVGSTGRRLWRARGCTGGAMVAAARATAGLPRVVERVEEEALHALRRGG